MKVLNEGLVGGHYSKSALRQFSPLAFPLDLGGKNLWARERNFSLGFSTPPVFSHSQTEENPLFYPIFHPIFSIPPKIHQTKHSVRFIRNSESNREFLTKHSQVNFI